jgi:large subunit ribosomal protein L11
MEKKIIAIIKLAITSGKATPAPPIGPALGQHGLNIMNFCKEYNTRTKDKDNLIIPVEISAYDDRSFSFILKTSPASILLKKVVNINKGSSKPNKIIVGHVTNSQLEEIANIKMQDLNTKNVLAAKRIIEGTARNMGIQITK